MSPKKPADKKRLVVLDTHAILHRGYHAMPEFASSKGAPTGALYGLVTMLLRIYKALKPDYVIAAFDLPDATFRHAAYAAFKAPRDEKAGFEADDIIGTVAEELKKEKNVEVIIASGDMDTMQLIDGMRVRVFTLK